MPPVSLTDDELAIGLSRPLRRVIAERDIGDLGRLPGDVRPLHSSGLYAPSQTQHPRRLAHGMHLAPLASCLVAMRLPRFRGLCLSQSFDFVRPACAGQEREVSGEAAGKQDPARAIVSRLCVPANGVVCVKGKAIVQALDSGMVAE